MLNNILNMSSIEYYSHYKFCQLLKIIISMTIPHISITFQQALKKAKQCYKNTNKKISKQIIA